MSEQEWEINMILNIDKNVIPLKLKRVNKFPAEPGPAILEENALNIQYLFLTI